MKHLTYLVASVLLISETMCSLSCSQAQGHGEATLSINVNRFREFTESIPAHGQKQNNTEVTTMDTQEPQLCSVSRAYGSPDTCAN